MSSLSTINTESSLPPANTNTMKGGTLLPPPPPSLDGGVQLAIHIEKIGLKSAAEYLDPFITIQVIGMLGGVGYAKVSYSIKFTDNNGEVLETSQDTPCANQKKENYIYFSCNVEIQTNINKLPSGTLSRHPPTSLILLLSSSSHFPSFPPSSCLVFRFSYII